VLTAEDVVALQDEVSTVKVEDSLIDYSLAIVERTRSTSSYRWEFRREVR